MNADLQRLLDVFLGDALRPLIALTGPTASGKTDLSIEIAKYIGGEVVNADSRQLYQYLDIGTAKILPEDMQGTPHHLLSLKDPKEEVTVAWYREQALHAIDDILLRKKIPILVGGSMLYIASITDALSLGPPPDAAIRSRLEREYDEDEGEHLFTLLEHVDPDSAASIHPKNKPAVVRALEIFEASRKPKSQLTGQKKCSYDLLMLGVLSPRAELLKRIEERTKDMLARGWIEEVRALLARGYLPSDPALKSHGYREICEFLEEVDVGEIGEEIEEAKERLCQRIITKTRQYAKRQVTWWRNDPRIHWIRLGE